MTERAGDRVLVVVCDCGPLIAESLDLDVLARSAAALPGVGRVERHPTVCSAEGRAWLAALMREEPDVPVVIAGCTPRENADTFAAACADAGRNAYTLARANIREQVAWVTHDREAAGAKALAAIAAAVARARLQEPLTAPEVACETGVLVVGAGVAGMTAAQLIADAGRDVVLVERGPAVGGRVALLSELYPGMECAPCLLEPLMDAVLHHPRIEVLTSAEVSAVAGRLGDWRVTIRRAARHVDADGCYGCRTCEAACPVEVPDEYSGGLGTRKAVRIPYPGALPNAAVLDDSACLRSAGGSCDACAAACPFGNIDLGAAEETLERVAGAIVLATGSAVRSEGGAYELPGVLTTWQFERMLNPDGFTAGGIRLADGREPASIALVHCGDERGFAPAERCSATCCLALAKHAAEIAHKLPSAEMVEYAWDRMRLAPAAAARVVRLGPEERVSIAGGGEGHVRVAVEGGESRDFDLVVVAAPLAAHPAAGPLASMLRVECDADGYVLPANARLRPSAARVDGVFAAGSACGEKDVARAASEGAAAAGHVLSALVPGRSLVCEAATARVDESRCGGCRVCTLACPYGAVSFDEGRRVAAIDELLCHGCGSCAAACPSSAIEARHFTREQLLAEIRTLTGAGPRP